MAMDSPISPVTARTATDSLVSVPLSDSARFSVAYHQVPHEESPRPERQDEDEEYMASLLARLEMENDALATDPKAQISGNRSASFATQNSAQDTDNRSLMSMHIPPEALGMSLGDFWAFVTRDYQVALAAMPTMTPIMIHKGVPDFLRPVVWSGLAEARDPNLYAEFDMLLQRLEYEQSSSESIIDKDLGRCFPTHELFMHPAGEGQAMLSQVLKCYSLRDPETGYCQGMGFVVGILLMKMQVHDAYSVFVRLMENHGLRDSYSKSLHGLHCRIYQFQQLLSPLSPRLLAHFKELGVEFAYLSQWFMTIFATTCPHDTLFRIYDVILAEGANETIMRVALSLILKNEQKLLNMVELEDVLQLLLGRDIWEPYEGNPDLLIEEVTTLFTQVVTKQTLEKLHKRFQTQSEGAAAEKTVRALGFGNLHGSAFKIFDNWWAPSKSTSLSPTALLRRTASKQSLSTLNSIGGSGSDSLASTDSFASTAPTEVDRDAERDSATPTKLHRSVRQEDRNLHEQVEGLLMALSEVQREAAQTAADLEREQRRRGKAQDIVGDLVKLFQQKKTVDAYRHQRRITLPSRIISEQTPDEAREFRRRSNYVKSVTKSIMSGTSLLLDEDAGLQTSLMKLCALFDAEQSLSQSMAGGSREHSSNVNQTGANQLVLKLEDELARLRQRMVRERARRHSRKTADLKGARLSRRHSDHPKSNSSESFRTRRDLYRRQARERALSSAADHRPSSTPGPLTISVPRIRPHQVPPTSSSTTSSRSASPRPRMIKTQDGRETPAPQKFSKRTSSLMARPTTTSSLPPPPPPDETLVLELVAAKTREATAMHERDEMKVALDRARRAAEAREAEVRAQMDGLHAVMVAQMQAHTIELERLKGFYGGLSSSGGGAGGGLAVSSRPVTPGSATSSPVRGADAGVHAAAAAPVASGKGGGWGWFGKGRSFSGAVANTTTG